MKTSPSAEYFISFYGVDKETNTRKFLQKMELVDAAVKNRHHKLEAVLNKKKKSAPVLLSLTRLPRISKSHERMSFSPKGHGFFEESTRKLKGEKEVSNNHLKTEPSKIIEKGSLIFKFPSSHRKTHEESSILFEKPIEKSLSTKSMHLDGFSHFSQSGMSYYNSAIMNVDQLYTSRTEGPVEKGGSGGVDPSKGHLSEKKGQVQRLSENKMNIFPNCKRAICEVASAFKVFPLHVSITSKSEEVSVYVSRWEKRPKQEKHELKFFSKEFRIFFENTESNIDLGFVYMAITTENSGSLGVTVRFAGSLEKSQKSKKSFPSQRLGMGIPETKKKEEIEKIKEYLDFYQKHYLPRKNKEASLAKMSRNHKKLKKISENIKKQPIFPEIREKIIEKWVGKQL